MHTLQRSLYHPAAGYVVLIVSLVLTGLAWFLALQYSDQRALDRFHGQISEVESRIRQRMDGYARLLRAGVALHYASDKVDRKSWQAFVSAMDLPSNYPGTQGIGVSVPILPEDLQAHIQSVQSEGFPEYRVKPAGVRDLYTSIVFLEPFDWRNQRAFGFDMYSEPMRRAAMDRARDTGRASISGKVTLVQETDRNVQAGLLMYVPIYQEQLPLSAGPAVRAETHEGYVYAVLRGDDLMKNILNNIGDELSVQIFDADPKPENLIHETRSHDQNTATYGLSELHHISIYGKQWSVLIQGKPGASYAGEYWQSTLVGLFGLLIDFLLFYTIHLIGRQRREKDHQEYNRVLQLTNDELQAANNELEKSNAALEKTSADLRQFAYTASHDMKSPLRAICMLTDFVQEDSAPGLSDASREHLDLIQARAARLGALLDDMMAYARSDLEPATSKRVNLTALINEVFASTANSEGAHLQLDIDVPTVRTAVAPLRHVLNNLIENSISHHDRPDQEIDMRVRWDNGLLRFDLSDDGPGIAPAFRDQVFDLFATINGRDHHEGSGMGLPIVRKLVESNCGEVHITDNRNGDRGVTVCFTWAAAREKPESTADGESGSVAKLENCAASRFESASI